MVVQDTGTVGIAAYRVLFEHSSEGVLFSTPDGRITAANPAACALLDMSAEEICRLGCDGLVDQEDPRWRIAVAERDRTGSSVGVARLRRGDGRYIDIETTSRLFRDEDGSVQVFSILHDITSRTAIEREMEELSTRLLELSHGDDLTGFQNRRGLIVSGTHLLQFADRQDSDVQIMFVDVGNVQELNERLGHHAGDAALQAVARALSVAFRRNDVLARIGGTQFLVLALDLARTRVRHHHEPHPAPPRRARDHRVRRRRRRGVLRLDDAPGRRPVVARGPDGQVRLGHARGEGRRAGGQRLAATTPPADPRLALPRLDPPDVRTRPVAQDLILTNPLVFSDSRVIRMIRCSDTTPSPSRPSTPRRRRPRVAPPRGQPPSARSRSRPCSLTALPAGAQTGGTVNLVAYSTPKPAYTVLATDFAKTKAGAGVTVSPSFGPSGTQATSVVDGLPADVVNFSLEPDMAKLVKAGLVSSSWDKRAHQGHGDGLHRLVRGAPGQSQAHHHLGRPREAGRAASSPPTCSARAAPSGTSWRPTAPSSRRARRRRRRRPTSPSCCTTPWPSPPAPALRCRPSSRGRVTCSSTTRTTPSTPSARARRSTSSRRRRRS